LWIAHTELAAAPGHPFYQRLNELLEAEGFDEFVENRYAKFYAAKYGRAVADAGHLFPGAADRVFRGHQGVLAVRGLLKGQRIAIDATTLEANAAMRSIVRRDTGESYEEFLRGVAKASGIETPTREDLARLDRKRKKRTSNEEWKSPADGDARIAKMKDGRTHLAHKAEHGRSGHGRGGGGHAARRR
jgi:transposase